MSDDILPDLLLLPIGRVSIFETRLQTRKTTLLTIIAVNKAVFSRNAGYCL